MTYFYGSCGYKGSAFERAQRIANLAIGAKSPAEFGGNELFKIEMRQCRLGNAVYGTRAAQAAKVIFSQRTRLHDALADNCALPTDPLWVLKELSRLRRAAIKRYPTNLPYDAARPWEMAPSGRETWMAFARDGERFLGWDKRDAETNRDDYEVFCAKMKKGQR